MIKDAPDIRMTEETGYPTDVRWPVCPVCGENCRWIYKKDGEVIGCDECVEECDAWEELDE